MLRTKWSKGWITYEEPIIMGIVNVTPDSFSDGRGHTDLNSIVAQAFRLIDDGANIIDIGGESTRPGWTPVSSEEEIQRLIPAISGISSSCDVPISVDTMKTEVAQAAIEAGANIINDVYGLRWEGMVELATSTDVPVIINHINGNLDTMHSDIMVGNVLPQIKEFFKKRVEVALDGGIKKNRIILDPGLGFGKTNTQNMEVLQSSFYFEGEYPILVGPSRKRFLATALGSSDDKASAKAAVIAADNGSHILRVHNVKATKNALSQKVNHQR